MKIFYRIALWVTRIAFFPIFWVSYKGRENVPKDGSYILAVNHRSCIDPILVSHGFMNRQVNYMAKSELFSNWFTRALFKGLGVVAVERGSADMDTLDDFTKQLKKDGTLVGIFPEGTRGPNMRPAKGKSGAAFIAHAANVGVIPCAIIFEGKLCPFKKVKIVYGKPIPPEELFPETEGTAVLKKCTKRIMAGINEIMDEEGVPNETGNC